MDGLRAEPLYAGGLLLAVGAEHPFARRDRVAVGELEGAPWIVSGAEGPQFDVWPTAPGPHRIVHAVRDWPGRLGLVAAGLGIATVPSIMRSALPAGVVVVGVDEPSPTRRSILAVSDAEPSPGATALIDALRAEGRALEG